MRFRTIAASTVLTVTLSLAIAAAEQAQPAQPQESLQVPEDSTVPAPDAEIQFEHLLNAMARLPLAAALATILALRPRRRGTPKRKVPVIQTQIILAVVGSVVMLVVGSSLARAFGIVGAAGLVRYRAKISDPKDAGVMLSTLAIGLACGVGLWMIATFATAFILGLLWVIESFEPKAKQEFLLLIKAKDPAAVKARIEELLHRNRLEFELRSSKEDEICYDVKLPLERKTDRLSDTILKLDADNVSGVEWNEKKERD